MKKLRFSGGTPKETGVKTRQVGTFSATPGVNAFKNNASQFDHAHQQKVQSSGSVKLSTKPLSRPNIDGKVDNRPYKIKNAK